ncbi:MULTISPECIES: BglG family transcription antiterminator [Paenibacillus]|uniref:BglG family transcription antiterminator n=1 Tax=Paenibacillus TaxID=44249 RepID=UPI0022B93DF6|nr:PRD domain-containing protein [Paenibacillus caseinilyticus]MCZ8519264.1 PRD domain-containing protein [Paenibacillus caseinilyticus]
MTTNRPLRIERVISNNVLMALDPETGKECVLLGKGLGFASKGSGTIESQDPRIEKRFRLDDREELSEYQKLLEGIDPDVIAISEKIIDSMRGQFEQPVNNKVYFALPSHIQFAVYRLRNGMDIVNPFLQETQMCFPKEYEIARSAAETISTRFGIDVPEDEIGFLAFHVHSAVSDVSVGHLVKMSSLVGELVEQVEERLGGRMSRDSMDYIRLVTHLRSAVDRIAQKKAVPNPFMRSFQEAYPREYLLASELGELIQERLGEDVPEDEIGYMVMHLYRLFLTCAPPQR